MEIQVTEDIFADKLIACDSTFSYRGAIALFEHLEQTGEEEFNPVAVRCSFQEYDNIEEVRGDYSFEDLDDLATQTTVIKIPKTDRLIIEYR